MPGSQILPSWIFFLPCLHLAGQSFYDTWSNCLINLSLYDCNTPLDAHKISVQGLNTAKHNCVVSAVASGFFIPHQGSSLSYSINVQCYIPYPPTPTWVRMMTKSTWSANKMMGGKEYRYSNYNIVLKRKMIIRLWRKDSVTSPRAIYPDWLGGTGEEKGGGEKLFFHPSHSRSAGRGWG